MAREHFDPIRTVSAAFPAGPERDDLIDLLRLGLAFRAQQRGRRPGFLRRYIADLVAERIPPPISFTRLLEELELAAVRRNDGGEREPIEHVSRANEVLTYHDPRRGRRQITFGRLRNLLTQVKPLDFPRTAKP